MGEIVVKYKNQNYAFMQLKGNAEMRGMFPVMFDYVVKYNINDAIEHQGKAKMKFDGKTPSKKFEMSFAPKTGTPMDFVWNMDFSSHIKYDNTAPRTAFLFTFLPYNMDRAWTYEGGREHTANGGFTMTHKITHGENVIQEGEMVFDVKTNDGSKFEMEH